MSKNTTLDAVAVAIWAASAHVHDLDRDENVEEMIVERMKELDVPESEFVSVRAIFDCLLGFANAVRVAERRQDPIIQAAKRRG